MEYVPRININDYKYIKQIGSGQFGVVSLVEEKKTKIEYAAKEDLQSEEKVTYDLDGEKSLKNAIIKEMKTYRKAKNAAILNCIGYSPYNLNHYLCDTIITEYMPNGSLDKILDDVQHVCAPVSYTNTARYIILLGIALGMKYLHNKGIIHRDLKPGNILLDKNLYPKICDFGCSKISDKELAKIMMKSQVGTPLYMAPEIFDEENYNYKVDVYAFSLIAYEIITERKPFGNEFLSSFQLIDKVINGYRPDVSIIDDDKIRTFLEKCWSPKQFQRPSFLQIVDVLMQDDFKKYFNITDENYEIEDFLDLFDDELKSPLSKDALDLKKAADNGDINAIYNYALMLKLIKKKVHTI